MDNQNQDQSQTTQNTVVQVPASAAPVNNQPPSTKKSLLSKKLIILIVVFMILVGGGATTYVAFNNKSKPAPIVPKEAPISTPSPTPVDETANWKTYVDAKLNFSIKYPPQIAIYRTLSEGGVEFVKSENKEKDLREVNTLAVYSREVGGTNPEEVFKNSECPKPCNEKIEQVELNNAMGVKTLGPGYPYTYNYYLTNKNKTATVVRLFISPNNIDPDKDLTLFEKMFFTFKFLDSTEPVACTQDVKLCPDGSYVERQPPGCEFAPCP